MAGYDNNSSDYVILNDEIDGNATDLSDHKLDPLLISKDLKKIINRLKGENLIDDKEVNYGSLMNSDLFNKDYLELASRLKRVNLVSLISSDDSSLNDSNLLAFFISSSLSYFCSCWFKSHKFSSLYLNRCLQCTDDSCDRLFARFKRIDGIEKERR